MPDADLVLWGLGLFAVVGGWVVLAVVFGLFIAHGDRTPDHTR